jgi:hypothetical protein
VTAPRQGESAPPALVASVERALRRHEPAADAARPTAEECLSAGEALLAEVLRGDARDRATALDLLTADALVTRAYELAAADPGALERLARDGMRRMAALAGAR